MQQLAFVQAWLGVVRAQRQLMRTGDQSGFPLQAVQGSPGRQTGHSTAAQQSPRVCLIEKEEQRSKKSADNPVYMLSVGMVKK